MIPHSQIRTYLSIITLSACGGGSSSSGSSTPLPLVDQSLGGIGKRNIR